MLRCWKVFIGGSFRALLYFMNLFSFLCFILLSIFNTIQNVFHPPYSKGASAAGILTVLSLGYGTMFYGMAHQQKKQGYWK